jgi:uncharacterized SAM-binding protein YcdF (DUF218 family)
VLKLTERERLIALIDNEPLKKADVIVLLEGDGYNRITEAVKLYKQGFSKRIVVSGGILDKKYGSFPAKQLVPRLTKRGVSFKDIIIDEKSKHTQEQSVEVLKLAKKNKWSRLLLVASHYHQYRAFLTFLKTMRNMKLKIQIINAPARELPWFKKNTWGRRIDLLKAEFERIENYRKLGHVATFREGIEYQKWKEGQR